MQQVQNIDHRELKLYKTVTNSSIEERQRKL